MILTVLIGHERRHAEGWPQMSSLIYDVLENLKGERTEVVDGIAYDLVGSVAEFSFADRGADHATNSLTVAVNRATGYGALVWCVNLLYPKKGGIYGRIWVSDNPQPPEFDTRVASDPWASEFRDPRSTLPLPRIRAALEEFCRTGTGDRPQSIDWVEAVTFGGYRKDVQP